MKLTEKFKYVTVTDRQTDRHTTTAYTALAWRRAIKIDNSFSKVASDEKT